MFSIAWRARRLPGAELVIHTGRIDPPGIEGTGQAFEFAGHEVFDFRGEPCLPALRHYDLLGLDEADWFYRSAAAR